MRAASIVDRQLPDVLALDFDDNYSIADIEDFHARLRVKVLVLIGNTDETYRPGCWRGPRRAAETRGACLAAESSRSRGQRRDLRDPPDHERMFVAAVQNLPRAEHRPIGPHGRAHREERQTIAAVTSDASAPVSDCEPDVHQRTHAAQPPHLHLPKLGVSGRLSLYAYVNQHGHRPSLNPIRSG